MRPTSILTALGCAWLTCVCTASHAQSAAEWQAREVQAAQKSETIMRDANKRASLLAQFQVMRYAYIGNTDPAFQVIFGQYLSWYQSFIGDYQDAAASFSIKQTALPDDRPSPLSTPQYSAEPTLTAIPPLARNHRAVFFNEAHNIPLTRTLTVELLAKLRAEGFNYFAAETVYQTDTGLQSRGYPTKNSGFYTREPICAEMVRTALKLGYKVIGYESAFKRHRRRARGRTSAQYLPAGLQERSKSEARCRRRICAHPGIGRLSGRLLDGRTSEKTDRHRPADG